MRKLERKEPSIDFIRLFDDYCKARLLVYEKDVIAAFGDYVTSGIAESVAKPSRVGGVRAELVFQTVVAGLADVKLIKAEDAGDVLWNGQDIAMPDF